MILTTSGLPPFAAFFSKGAVITSIIEAGNLFQIILIFATTMLTFAYSLRFMTLVFMGEQSKHLKKLHLHEAPKIMLIPAAVLAVLCIGWGWIEPWLVGFMNVEADVSILGAFLSWETAVFFAILVPAGLIIYLTYYKKSELMTKIRSDRNPLTTILKNGYFFDNVYEGMVAKGVVALSNGTRKFENTAFGIFPQLVAGFVISFAMGVHKYLDVLADQLLDLVANRTFTSALKMKKLPSSSLQHYLAAALLGFILIVLLIIATVGM